MQPERDAAAAATPPGDGARSTAVQAAVEQFIELHATGQRPDPAAFAAGFPADVRPQLLAQCREFLAFDGLLGHQEWAPAPAKETPGRSFGDFVIQEELGRGGMGVVYLAHQKSLNRRVALKVMASGLTLSKRHVERFRREAAAAAQLRHPAIVSVHALTEVDGTFALAMDYVAGRNLADLLDDLRLANGDGATTVDGSLGLAPEKGYVAECAMFCSQLASALAVAHQANVVHRDLKPRNLMLDDRRQVRLLDFGLAKSLGEGSISMSGEITGTAHYMSPEQTLAKRVEVDHRADIWALGVILYEMLTLRRPFDGKNLQQIVYQICFQEPVSPQRWNHKVPRDLVTICQKALEKDPNKRYQTAAGFEADLLRFLRWEPIHARPASAWTRVAKWTRRHRLETAIAAVVLLTGVGALAFSWYRGQQADSLLAQAKVAKDEQRFGDAKRLANEALALRNDEITRALLESYSSDANRVAAEATSLALKSRALLESDRPEALRLALLAERKHSSLDTRSAVLDALGSGYLIRDLRLAAGAPPQLVHACWSPDGEQVVTVGYGGEAHLWDAASAAHIATLTGHDVRGPIVSAAFAGAERIVTVGVDRTLRLWQRRNGALAATIPLPGTPHPINPDRDGSRILVPNYGSQRGPFLAQVFDTATGQPIGPAVAHPHQFVRTALSADGTIAASCAGNEVRVWSVDTGLPLVAGAQPIPTHGPVGALCFAPDASVLAIASGDTVQLLRPATQVVVGALRHSLDVVALAFDSKGQRLVSGSLDLTARVWQLTKRDGADAIDATEVATLTGHRGQVDRVAFDPTDQLVLTGTGGQRGSLFVFDVGAGRPAAEIHRYEAGQSIRIAEFAPDGRSVLAQAGERRAFLWDFRASRGVVTLRQSGWAGAVAFDRSGEHVITGGTDQHVRCWSLANGNPRWKSARFAMPQVRLDVDGAGECFACSSINEGTVHVLRVRDGAPLYDLPGLRSAHDVRFARLASRLLAAGAVGGDEAKSGRVLVWNTNDRSTACDLVRPLPVVAADISADGTLVAIVEEGEAIVRVFDVVSGAARAVITAHDDRIHSVRFAPGGDAVLTASKDMTARLHDLDGNRRALLRSEHPLKTAAFSHDGALVLTCTESTNAEAVLWRVADASEHMRFRGHRGVIECGLFARGDQIVATTARDGTVCIWPTDPVGVASRLRTAAAASPAAAGR